MYPAVLSVHQGLSVLASMTSGIPHCCLLSLMFYVQIEYVVRLTCCACRWQPTRWSLRRTSSGRASCVTTGSTTRLLHLESPHRSTNCSYSCQVARGICIQLDDVYSSVRDNFQRKPVVRLSCLPAVIFDTATTQMPVTVHRTSHTKCRSPMQNT